MGKSQGRKRSSKRRRSNGSKKWIPVFAVGAAATLAAVLVGAAFAGQRTATDDSPARTGTPYEVGIAQAPIASLPDISEKQVLFQQSFAETPNTDGGYIGRASTGSEWFLTGPGLGSARVENGQFVSPDAVSYAVAGVAERPAVVIVRNVWTGKSGPTFALLAPQEVFAIKTWQGVHIQTSNTAINGWLAATSDEGGPVKVPASSAGGSAYELEHGVEYETRGDFDYAANSYRITVTNVASGVVVSSVIYSDPSVSSRLPAGPVQLMIEPGANVAYLSVVAYA